MNHFDLIKKKKKHLIQLASLFSLSSLSFSLRFKFARALKVWKTHMDVL